MIVILCVILGYFIKNPLITLDSLYKQGDFEKILEITEKIDTVSLNSEEKSYVYFIRGVAFIAFREFENAKKCFKLALKYNPEIELSEKEYSPMIIETFEEVKKNIEKEKKKRQKFEFPYEVTQSVPVEERRIGNKKISLPDIFLPGFYTFKYENKLKGSFVFAGFLISACGILYSHIKFNYYYDKYMQERNPEDIEKLYRKSEFYYRLRLIFTWLSVSFIFYNFYDITH